MKKLFAITMLALTLNLFSFADSCNARAAECTVSCSATSPAGGSVDCYEFSDRVECSAYDQQGQQVYSVERDCSGEGNQQIDCQIYWWLCITIIF